MSLDFQEIITNKMNMMRQEELKTMDILTVGELIAKLEPIVKNQQAIIDKYKQETTVCYDFEYLHPSKDPYDSWRGVYAELAIDFTSERYEITVSEFLEKTKEVVGKEFTGYKGGEFVMGKTTPIWVANYGHSGRTGLVDVLDEEYQVILITRYFSD